MLSERALKLRSRWVTCVPVRCLIANAFKSVSEIRHYITTRIVDLCDLLEWVHRMMRDEALLLGLWKLGY